ncbi:MAG: hypothetical protein ACK42K_07525 [Leptonema sp. (in: bacteria)]
MNYIQHPSELSAKRAIEIFNQSIIDYHKTDNIYENSVYDFDFLKRILKNYEYFQ